MLLLDYNFLARLVIPVRVALLALTPSVDVAVLVGTFGGFVWSSYLVVAANTHALGIVSIVQVWTSSNGDSGSPLFVDVIRHLWNILASIIRHFMFSDDRTLRFLKVCVRLLSWDVWVGNLRCVYSEAELRLSILNFRHIEALDLITYLYVRLIFLHL